MKARFPRIASFKTPARLRAHLEASGLDLPCDDALETGPASPLARPLDLGSGWSAPNRFVIQPMEGWDAEADGNPSALTRRRWRRFGASGAGWIWGGEAVAVVPEGRANPCQMIVSEGTAKGLASLREDLVGAARAAGLPEPVVGLQLTHSGRWSMPEAGRRQPRTAYAHPLLDRRVGASDAAVLDDAEVDALVAAFARAAGFAADCGFDFVDVKHCHGYLLHEFLSARLRGGRFGGEALEARTRLGLSIVDAVKHEAPGLRLGVRLSVFDALPRGADGSPEPIDGPYRCGFGCDPDAPAEPAFEEPIALVRRFVDAGAAWINVTASSPYYAPHLQRPAAFPPSDGYPPPEDPLVGVARLLGAARAIKQAVPDAVVVASGTSYLQDFLPHVAQACLRRGDFDAVGYGRMALSYPRLAADVLAGRPLERGLVCRTFSDCTTAPRHGLVSGCWPLDDAYRERPEHAQVEALRRRSR